MATATDATGVDEASTPASPATVTTAGGTLAGLFEDLHDSAVYGKTKQLCANEKTQNFVVEFNHTDAVVAFDLTPPNLAALLNTSTAKGRVRWINIWAPSAQASAMRVIGDQYGFSSRLQAILTMRSAEELETKMQANTANHTAKSGAVEEVKPSESVSDKADLEHGSPITETRLQREMPANLKKDLSMYRIVKDTMGFTSVDQGSRFICLGANWLHERGQPTQQLLQPKHWSWLTLCADHTVISVQEAPIFEHPKDTSLRQKELENMRSNAVGILLQLSQQGLNEFKDVVIGLKSVRDTMKPDHGQVGSMRRTISDMDAGTRSDLQLEGSSNLFYYLFEDYGGAAAILEMSKKIVHDLDRRVLASSHRRSKLKTRDIIPELHTLRKELRQLQNLFQSYKNMIRRVSHPRHVTAQGEVPSGPIHLSGDVRISQSARSRFDRLEDRLQLLMLNTIQECLEEQNALSDTYFKITTQKDSQATARLTGSATLLAKLSVFFLPISFMTAFFSVEIPDFVDSYTPKTYYVAFGVIAGLSFIALFFFSRLLMFFSDVVEDWTDNMVRRFKGKRE